MPSRVAYGKNIRNLSGTGHNQFYIASYSHPAYFTSILS